RSPRAGVVRGSRPPRAASAAASCCARAASGQAAAPPRSAMNSRRFIQSKAIPIPESRTAAALAARRPAPLMEPGAVLRHLGALCPRRAALAGRGLLALLRRAPAQLDAVVQVVGHFEPGHAVDHVLDGKRPRRSVAARV